MTIIIFFLILSGLILIHEFGHFFVAKKSGVKVHEFGLGLPPKIFGKKYGDTEYTLNWLPIGGFVRIEGEDPSEKVVDPKHSFQNKSPKTRLFILLAGILMNTFLAVFLFFTYFLANNFTSSPIVKITDFNFVGAKVLNVETVVSQVKNDALKDKIEPGDVVYNVLDGDRSLTGLKLSDLNKQPKNVIAQNLSGIRLTDFQDFVDKSEGELTVNLYNVQTGKFKDIVTTPTYNEEVGRKLLGVYLGSLVYLDYNQNIFTKASSGFLQSYNVMGYSLKAFSEIISYSFKTRDASVVSSGVSGPVGIFSIIQSVLKSGSISVVWTLIDLTAVLSLSLAFMNLLPIPALDGGRAVFVLVESITKKPVNPVIEGQIHKFGMVFLLLLLALITLKDVINLF
ncbi:hypothetical protein GW755_00465 [bacterium]|nr:hypothetical protein [bacterium]